MRLIDADKLLNRINYIYNGYMNDEEGSTPNSFVDIVKEQTTVSQWISTNDRLPSERFNSITGEPNQYIMQLKGFMPTAGYIDNEGQWYFDPHANEEAYNVVAWQPMPERYKEVIDE